MIGPIDGALRFQELPPPDGSATASDELPRVRVLSLGDKATSDIPIWRTVSLGTYRTIDALRDALLRETSGPFCQ